MHSKNISVYFSKTAVGQGDTELLNKVIVLVESHVKVVNIPLDTWCYLCKQITFSYPVCTLK